MRSRIWMGTLQAVAVLAAVVLSGMAPAARAAETINLTIVSGFPTVAAVVKLLQENYIPEVNKALARELRRGVLKMKSLTLDNGTEFHGFKELEAHALKLGEVTTNESGRQEYLENLFNRFA